MSVVLRYWSSLQPGLPMPRCTVFLELGIFCNSRKLAYFCLTGDAMQVCRAYWSYAVDCLIWTRLSGCLVMYLSFGIPWWSSICLSVYLTGYLCVSLCICVCMSGYQSIYLCPWLTMWSVCLHGPGYVCLSPWLAIYLSVVFAVCLSPCPWSKVAAWCQQGYLSFRPLALERAEVIFMGSQAILLVGFIS